MTRKINTIARGVDVQFSSVFEDSVSPPIQPSVATVTIAYRVSGVPTTTQIPMALQADGAWTGVWNSGAADAGLCEWFISAGLGADVAQEGAFVLTANRANVQRASGA